MKEKQSKTTKSIITITSLFLAMVIVISYATNFLNAENYHGVAKILLTIVFLPENILLQIPPPFTNTYTTNTYSIAAWILFLGTLGPIISFFFWFLIFNCSAKLIKYNFKTANVIVTNIVPIFFMSLLVVSVAVAYLP